ncbi:nucleoside deaminase [Naumannella halotolerans]|uniref:tRNA(Arg) A34 adenosine deaminase TadA n=1 Tax=Naumannella halotolerans TaxID=993414 RepID=A0A4R7IYS7_9ACTN|nr:nucleoside deaminase [Naumannella halotolerans]TDT29049.1 tRNA(Arg) A34 adenosine deaminase TadA [Naumannella halotolerans]
MTSEVDLITRLLQVINDDIVPLTAAGVAEGNKLFGAAILDKRDLSVVIAETNNEIDNPLWHGEVHALKKFYELPRSERPSTSDCLFLATHEPCSLCLSAITWTGFDNFWFLFSHTDSRDSFAIPHDLRILQEVFGVAPGGYARSNAYWSAHAITEELAALPPAQAAPLQAQVSALRQTYDQLSSDYQASKAENDIPLA